MSQQAAPRSGRSGFFGDQMLLGLVAAFIVVVVAYPVVNSFRAIQLDQFSALLTSQNLIAIRNTAVAAVLTIPPSLLIAVPMAWLCTRTNMPWRGSIIALVGTSFVMPMLFTTIAYVMLFGKNAGLINLVFADILGGPLYDIYSFSGVVFIAVLQCFPLIFFTTVSGLGKVNPELEEAARVAGLSSLQVFLRVTLGVTMPSIMAGVAFSFATAVTMLSGPLILAVPIGMPFLTSEMYAAIVWQTNIPRAVALSLPLLLTTIAALWVQSWLVRDEGARFATVSGKGARSDVIDLGRWRVPALLLCLAIISVSLFLPFLVLLAAGLMQFWWKGFIASNFTFEHFSTLLGSSTMRLAIWNSVVLSFGTAAFLALFGTAAAIVLGGRQTLLKQSVRALGLLPLGIAHVIAGVMVILAWYGYPFELGSTIWLLGLGYVLVMLPYAVKTTEAGLGQIDLSLADAARICGCSPLSTWRHILFPLMRSSIFTTFVLVFLFCIKEFPMTALIYSADTMTLAVRVYSLFESGSFEQCGAAAVLLLGLAFVALFVGSRVFKLSISAIKV